MYESGSHADNAPVTVAPGAVVEAVVAVLRGERAGLVTDVDGTISPIVPRPDQARVLPAARLALAALRDRLTLTAVVSGRTAADARQMVGVPGLTYIGNHGLEIVTDAGPRIVPEAAPWLPRLAALLGDLRTAVDDPAILFENKGASASLHYRLAAEPERARARLLALLAASPLTDGLRVEEGRMVLNVLPPLNLNKGTAVGWLIHEHQLRHVVYLGDDVTDAHAFRALAAQREAGDVRAVSVGVIGAETPPSVREMADLHVGSVAAIADLLVQAVAWLGPSATMD